MIPVVNVNPTQAVTGLKELAKIPYTHLVNQLALNSQAFAQGNGFTGTQLVNGITHTYVSAEVYFELGPAGAEKFGNLKEVFGDDPRDTWRDQWNNEVGRRMAKWAQDNGYGSEVIDRLILDAMNDPSHPIITDLNDPRIGIYDFDGDGFSETCVYPEPTWQQPHDWDESPWFTPDDPLRPRDYTGLPDPLSEAGEWFKDRWRDFSNGMEHATRRALRAIDDFDHWVRDIFRFPFGRHDPLILDLDLNGVQLTALDGSNAHFDFDLDSFAERTGWISSGDALLVRDVNANNLIDDGGELFGGATEDGFTALAAFDLNADGVINASDPIWADLRLWKDSNQDGVTQAGEIVTLASQNVASIDLAAAASNERRAGNSILFAGGFSLTGGARGEAVAVAFSTDQVNTVFQLPEGFEYDPEVFSLPNLRGYGEVADLWVAMSLDPILKAMVKDLIADASAFTSLQDVVGEYFVMAGGGFGGVFYPHAYNMQAFDHMLARWTGVDSGDEERVQAENIAEKFMNEQADHAYGNPFFYQAFEKFATELGVRFYAQVAQLNDDAVFFQILESFRTAVPANGVEFSQAEIEAILAPARALFASPPVLDPDLASYASLDFDFSTDSIGGDIAGFIDDQLQGYDFDPLEPWEGYAQWYLERKALLEAIDPDGLVLDERHRAYTHNHDLAILEGPNAVYSEIVGGSGNDVLVGDPSGTLVKTDLLVGGAGNDTLQGGQGDDTYVFSDGSGADIVSDTVGNNEIAFQDGLVSTLARYSFANGNWQDLLISFAGRAETVTVIGYFSSNGAPTLERITFPDGLQASGRPIRDGVFASLATSGDDVITSFPLATTLVGLAGNDTLTGRGGDDILIGGVGNDLLSGGGGNDVYRFAPGDGHDIVQEYSNGFNGWGGTDTIEFGADIDPADIVVTQADYGWDLVLTRTGTGDSITLDGTVNGANARVEQVSFADGTVWTHADMMAMAVAATAGNDNIWGDSSAETLSGGAGNDVIDARAGNDVLVGGAGNDTLYGSGGNDTYVFARGDGDDIVREYANGFSGWGGTDTIEFAAGIAPADITVSQADFGYDLVLTIAGTTDRITIDGGLNGGSNYRIEQVRFADGTVWSWSELVARSTGGTAGNDSITGDSNANSISSGAGNDTIEGRQGDDTLIGGAGNDVLYGSGGNDTYAFARGDGVDIVRDFSATGNGTGGTDTIEFGEGIAPTDIVVSHVDSGWDLVLTIAGTGDSITLDSDVQDSRYRIERVVFADGTVWTHEDLMAKVTTATAGADNFIGTYDNDSLSGGAGNDTLDGRAGNDALTGGTGNDTLYGSTGADTYVYNPGDGDDTLLDFQQADAAAVDTIVFGAGITPATLVFSRVAADWSDIRIGFVGQSGSILVDNQHWGDAGIESIAFADGTVWNLAQITARYVFDQQSAGNDTITASHLADTINAGAGDDFVSAGWGADVIAGGAGDDRLEGNEDSDTYLYNVGDGHDVIFDYKGSRNNVLQFGPGITLDELLVSRPQGDGGSVRIAFKSFAGSVTILNQTWGDAGVETIRFADNTPLSETALLQLIGASTNGNDTLTGTSGVDQIWAQEGADTVSGLGGADILRGQDGNDLLVGGEGADTLYGGAGDDSLRGDIASGLNLVVNGGFEQSGTVVSSPIWGKVNSSLPGWTRSNSQNFEQTLSGTAGVAATEGNYWLDLDSGGGSGSNMAISQTVSGLVAGQAIALFFDHANRTSAASGSFEVWWNGALVLAVTTTGTAMVTDRLDLTAVAGDNVLKFVGLGTTDNAGASLDNVRLYAAQPAGAGPDVLDGGDGNDLLDGGGGADLLTGGTGADTFRFDGGDSGLGAAADRIADFLSGTDRIDLSTIDAKSAVAGDQAFTFIGAAAFSGVAGELRYAYDGADTWVEADVDGDCVADFQIVLSGSVVPVAADFIL